KVTDTPAGGSCSLPTTSSSASLQLGQQVTSVSNAIISPSQASSAGVQDNTSITVSNPVSVAVTGITARLRAGTSIGGALVRELTVGSLSAGASASVTWDGRDTDGAFVADGTYTARAYSPCAGENDAGGSTVSILVDNANPTVSLVSPSPPDNQFVAGNVTLAAAPLDLGGN